jgi:hypothetical protein
MKTTDDIIHEHLSGAVIAALNRLKDQRMIRSTCAGRLRDLSQARITEIIQGRRKVTQYYLKKLAAGGILNITKILAGRDLSALPPEEQLVLKRLLIDDTILDGIIKVLEKGKEDDLKTLLKILGA